MDCDLPDSQAAHQKNSLDLMRDPMALAHRQNAVHDPMNIDEPDESALPHAALVETDHFLERLGDFHDFRHGLRQPARGNHQILARNVSWARQFNPGSVTH